MLLQEGALTTTMTPTSPASEVVGWPMKKQRLLCTSIDEWPCLWTLGQCLWYGGAVVRPWNGGNVGLIDLGMGPHATSISSEIRLDAMCRHCISCWWRKCSQLTWIKMQVAMVEACAVQGCWQHTTPRMWWQSW